MKKYTFAMYLLILVFIVVMGCAKSPQVESPKAEPDLLDFEVGFAHILISGEDCANVATELSQYIDSYADVWRSALSAEIIRRVDAGQAIEDATEESFKFPPEIEEEIKKSACLYDSEVRQSIHKYEDEIPRKAYEAVEAHYSSNSESD